MTFANYLRQILSLRLVADIQNSDILLSTVVCLCLGTFMLLFVQLDNAWIIDILLLLLRR